MNNHLELGRISSDALYICSSKMNIPLIGKSLNNENWRWRKETEDEQKERKVNSVDLDTDHVSR
jgi:CRISPR/Cas system-associated protein Cas7 (RAMP superfamily)